MSVCKIRKVFLGKKIAGAQGEVFLSYIHLFQERLSEKMSTRQSRGNMGYGQFTVPDTVAFEPTCYFPLAVANICPWPLVPFSQIYLKNSELKTIYNTFRNCGVHFFRQPFLK